MKKAKIYRIIVKYLNREADYLELEALDKWLRDEGNVPTFTEFVKTQYITVLTMAEYNVDRAKESIRNKIQKNKRRNRWNVYRRLAVAASLVLMVGLAYFNWWGSEETTKVPAETIGVLEPGSDKAILTLEDGSQVALENGKKFQNEKVNSTGKELIYNNAKQDQNEKSAETYHYLTIPRGGQHFVRLSDGTKVWLNSDSKIKYPTRFQKGRQRNVELLYGEAYFEVSPSSNHGGMGFGLVSKSQTIEVLGTKFNIKAYDGEKTITTTLVEGKVKVKKGASNQILEPNQQAQVGIDNDSIQVFQVAASRITSWVDGLFIFEEESLHEMMKILSRWYDAEVFFENEQLKNVQFTGVLERTNSIEDILNLVEASSDGQVSFKVKKRVIIVKQ